MWGVEVEGCEGRGEVGKKVWWGRKGWEGQVRLCGPPPLSEPT